MDDQDVSAPTPEIVEEPRSLVCPITMMVYVDPVFVPESGNTYERAAIARCWASCASSRRDPITNLPVNSTQVYTNWDKRREVQAFLDAHPCYTPEGWTSRQVPPPPPNTPAHTDSSRWQAWSLRGIFIRTASVGAAVIVTLALFGIPLENEWTELSDENTVIPTLHKPLASTSHLPSHPTGVGSKASNHHNHHNHPHPSESHLPGNSRVKLVREGMTMQLEIGPMTATNPEVVSGVAFAGVWTGLTGLWTVNAARSGAPAMFIAFSIPFWALGMHLGYSAIIPAVERVLVRMDTSEYELTTTWLGFKCSHHAGLIQNLSYVVSLYHLSPVGLTSNFRHQ